MRDLKHLYRKEPALHELDCERAGFEWIGCDDAESSVVSLLPRGESTANLQLALCSFTPVPRKGFWREALNSDAVDYGGSGVGNRGGLDAEPVAHHGRPFSLVLTLPPLSVSFFVNHP